MTPMKHQLKASSKLLKVLRKKSIALLSGEPRSGKTLSFLVTAMSYRSVLVVTQKSALKDIQKAVSSLMENTTVTTKIFVTTFHQVHKTEYQDFDLVIIDEAHRWITGYPKRSTIWHKIRPYCVGKDMIFSSGTLTPEGYAGLYNMLALSDHSPWKKYSRFTKWHEKYGKPYSIRINGIDIKQYDRTKERKVLKDVKKITVSLTRKEGGHKHEAEDHVVGIDLSKKQQRLTDTLTKDLLAQSKQGLILADTPTKLLQKLHQISGGFVKGEDDYLLAFKKNPKVEWLQRNIDPAKTIILSHYRAEQSMLAGLFPNTGSTTRNAEGVDYSHFETMVIYSHGFSAATYQQVRARQMNVNRKTPVKIIFLQAGLDEYVYKAVKAKHAFTANWYRRNKDG